MSSGMLEDDILHAIGESEHPFATTEEVAERVGLDRHDVHEKLRELQNDEIEGRRIHGTYIWWFP